MATELWIQTNGTWIPILSIPTDQFDRFTLRPLKWLRFLGFIIYGRDGMLRTHCDGPEVDNYDIGTSQLRECYYFFLADQPRFVDTQALHERESSAYSLRREHFSASVMDRDQTCIVTGEPARLCNPSHCLPHSKGDEYIQQFTTIRGDSDDDVIEEINDPRNRFLVSFALHALVGSGESAFIQTPNFRLNRSDIPPSPNSVPGVHTERLTLQHFHDPSPQTNDRAAQNQDARLPETLQNWPPTLITNFVYGCAVLKRWGKPGAVNTLQKLARETYYDPRPLAQTAKHDHRSKEKTARSARLNRKNSQGVGGEEQKMDIDIMDILMFLRYQSSSASNRPPMQQGPCPEDVSTAKVQAWLQAH